MKILPPEQIKSYLTAADQRGVLPMFYLELISGLRKGELVALQWSDLDIENKTISVSKQAGRNNAGEPDITRPKTENSIRKISIPQEAVDLLIAEHQKHPGKQSGCAPHGGASEEAFCFLRFFFQDKICQRLPCLPLAFRREVRTARKQLCIYREKQLASCLLKNIRFTAPDPQPESG